MLIAKKYHNKKPKKELKKQCHKIKISFVLAIIESFTLDTDRKHKINIKIN